MASNGHAPSKYACKCLNLRIHAQPTQDTPPSVEAGFIAVHVADQGIRVAHPEVTLRSRSKPVPDPESSSGELTRYTTVTCLVCGLPTYRVLQRITPDLISEVGPVLPTDDWVEKELVKSATGWLEVYQGCLTDDEIAQTESSPMYSSTFSIVLPGPKPPAAATAEKDDVTSKVPDARGPSEQSKRHLPDLPPLFLPPPFTPSHIVFSHFSALATEQSQKLRDEAEEYIAQVTQQKVAEIRKQEAALKEEVNLIWSKFRDSVRLVEETGLMTKSALPLRRRGSVSGHTRTVSSPAPATSASVRVSTFVPTPSPPARNPSNSRAPAPSALSASLKTSGFHHPDAQKQANGSASASRRSLDFGPPSRARASPTRPGSTRADSLSTASSRTVAIPVDAEASIREAYRREIDESKDVATSFRYVMDLEAQMEQSRLDAEEEHVPPPVASTSQAAEAVVASASRGRSPRVHKSAIKQAQPAEQPKSEDGAKSAAAEDNKESAGKGKRKVTFDVKPEVAIIKDEGEAGTDSEQRAHSASVEDPIFDMDNETDQASDTRIEVPAEQPKASTPTSAERSRIAHRNPHRRTSSNSGLPPMLSSLRPASLPAPSAMRPVMRQPPSPVTESSERPRSLRESLMAAGANSSRSEAAERPIEIRPQQQQPEDEGEPADPREAEFLRLVAASTPSHRSAWKKNSKAWQMFLNGRERRANEVDPGRIVEESHYAVMDDFNPQPHPRFNGVADSDVTDEEEDENKWVSDIARSPAIPIGPLGRGMKISSYQPKASLPERPVSGLRNGSSSSLRHSSYAERPRSMDPGALDFAVDADVADDDVESDPETGGKARQRALKILKAREEIPAAGMWRSLA
ncbi:hypothetical protein GY45DRAFT_1327182 [Cubamyces sp. BRFM 1775]|nr:hypothetical protein GY45DRAFT_1327182 [Cubamyces sp. BRFM 1775]